MGIDDIPGNLARMAAGGALFILPTVAVLAMKLRRSDLPVWDLYALGAYLSIAGWFWSDRFFFPSLPLIVAVMILFLLRRLLTSGKDAQEQSLIPLLSIAVFSIGMLSKMLFNCRIHQYGFYVTFPALLFVSIMLVWYRPAWLDQFGRGGRAFRYAMLVFLGSLALHYFWIGIGYYGIKTYPVTFAGGERIMTFGNGKDVRGVLVSMAIQWIGNNVPPDRSMLVLPEGVSLNFYTRRENQTRYNNFMPPELIHYGEVKILEDSMLHPPDVIVLVLGKDMTEYGVGPFGLDPANGALIVDWIESAYRPVALFGGDPLEGKYLGIKIYLRNAAPGEGSL